MQSVIQHCVSIMNLKKPYKVSLVSKMRDKVCAFYTASYSAKGILLRHNIKVNMQTVTEGYRTLNSLIVHEFIHAWQEEHNITEFHGKDFERMAKILEIFFQSNGYTDVTDVFIKGTDI